MDVFDLRNRLIRDYAKFVRSFIAIQDARIAEYVDHELEEGALWPDPLVQLNPSFEPGETIDELADQGVLHDECRRIFRLKSGPTDTGKPLRLHRHQADAVRVAASGGNYVLTTGTGSGKSLAYIIPIVDHVLRNGTGRGIQAIIVYPMNALANSQTNELVKFIHFGYADDQRPVTFRRYTGQESAEEQQQIVADPPDILLTNYVMLELLLTRPHEKPLVRAASGLRFLVLDELHTYRGRQGADVAMLVRRARNAFSADTLQCVGTSATLASGGRWADQQAEVARVASQILGATVEPQGVIGETLRRMTPEENRQDPMFLSRLAARVSQPSAVPESFEQFLNDPLASWIESTFGVRREPESGRFVRQDPRRITGPSGAAEELSRLTGQPPERCVAAIQQMLLAGYTCLNPDTGFPVFAFRVHQFISGGDTAYASLEPEQHRYVTLHGQQYVPGDRRKVLLPLAFCRECGQEYYCVRLEPDETSGRQRFLPRDLRDTRPEDDSKPGFLYVSTQHPWPDEAKEMLARLPEDWLDADGRILGRRRKELPQAVNVTTDGRLDETGLRAWYLPAPFRFCLRCGVSYGTRQRSDFQKLSTLGSGGRSTATTILSLAAIVHLREMPLAREARKLLSFTDNRQDASLQAGHFNDFVEVGRLRAALYLAAVRAGADGLRHDELAMKVFDALGLRFEDYASDPSARFQARDETNRVLRHVLGYRLYRDLLRGWRVTAPNLEQVGLLVIDYPYLRQVCEATDIWQSAHPSLANASVEQRMEVSRVLLDLMRRSLAVKVEYLDQQFQERLLLQSSQRLIPPWGFDENDQVRDLEHAAVLYPRAYRPGQDYGGDLFLSSYSGFGQYVRRPTTLQAGRLTLDDTARIIRDLLRALQQGGILTVVHEPHADNDVPGYQLLADSMVWKAGDGTRGYYDPIRQPTMSAEGKRPNPFFQQYYRDVARLTHGIEAREHTAQVSYEHRQKREEAFREGRLPVLYCSPTMELGIDIAQLNAVNMRNVPPTPANYAQRSGRAGRSGQPALVFTYCASGSPHDQYFYRQSEKMVAGVVSPPQIDLANEDLIRSHVQAIWLSETGLSLGVSLRDLLDLTGDPPSLALLPHVEAAVNDVNARNRARHRAEHVLKMVREDPEAARFDTAWLDMVLSHVGTEFNRACDRWRGLYRSAYVQAQKQSQIILDASRSPQDKQEAQRLRREAEAQLRLLMDAENIVQSDFYSYRYFASEGFLPGYNFPRLPLSAYIPGRRLRANRDEFVSRPRFLAISEFGPRAIVYHEGSRYIINQVILPVQEEGEDIHTRVAFICPHCGYMHPGADGTGPDICERCRCRLGSPLRQLFRLQNVVTKRRDRISCDEEERLRHGYELRTAIRFAEREGAASYRVASLEADGRPLATLYYGHAATLWRINMGWRRRRNQDQTGFVLDIERGYWARSDDETPDADDPMSPRQLRVIPFVEDRRNCLIFEPASNLGAGAMASLQAALKNAIQVRFELEDSELASEPMPRPQDRRSLLFYESAEGGAGVLRRLVEDESAVRQVAEVALRLCHFDPATGDDLRRSAVAKEDCEAACYDCLMSYTNQPDHELLDRKSIRDVLRQLAACTVRASAGPVTRAAHLEQLLRLAGSELERKWLRFIDERNCRLPTHAQARISACNTRPDFLYRDEYCAIYVDGPHHQFPERAQRDREQESALAEQGWTVVRFGHDGDWQAILDRYPNIFRGHE
ncbi:DEAD/DEAH box helicase [Fontivita pretiosa]|uniref:DEAD/DEAH box helicase n=1 Tax=Fontivita pretiosa TaxID=2989684 RepID=UPI003D17F68E